MTGEQTVLQVNGWTEIVGATGTIILQTQFEPIFYYIGTGVPVDGTDIGVRLHKLAEHTPNIKATEKLYVRCQAATSIDIAWSE